MAGPFVARGFTGKRRAAATGRVPSGQHVTTEFLALPTPGFMVDIHCVTKWPRLNTRWHGA